MAVLIDENGITCFVDQNGITCFVDENGNTLCCGGGTGGGSSQGNEYGVYRSRPIKIPAN